jgi:hypothetical protein
LRKSCVNRCGTQCKWNNLKSIESHKCSNTVEWEIPSVSDIERTNSNSKVYLSNIARILASISSSRGLPVQTSSRRSWRPSHTSVIHNQAVRSAQACSSNRAWSLYVISWTLVLTFQRNRMITFWSYSIRNLPWTDFKVQNEKIITSTVAYSKSIWSI